MTFNNKNKNTTKLPSNRSFGYFFSIVFIIFAIYSYLNLGEFIFFSLILAVIFFILGFFNSKLLLPLNKLWMKIGIFLGNIVSPLVMCLIFFIILTPISILLKILKKDVLRLKRNKKQSYWITRSSIKSDMKNQF